MPKANVLDIHPYEIGRQYLVPVVRGEWCGRIEIWPVLGPLHSDADYIGFKPQHYHIDPRFLPTPLWRHVVRTHDEDIDLFKYPLCAERSAGRDPVDLQPLNPELRVCRREWPPYPGEEEEVYWFGVLEAAFADAQVGPGLICPHRGASLAGLTPRNGCVECPLHGLRWDCETGKLRPRTEVAHGR